jgi:hypothetical protein
MPSRCRPLRPHAATHARRMIAHLCLEADATHVRAQRRTLITATGPLVLRGGPPTLEGGRRSPPPARPCSEEDQSPLPATGPPTRLPPAYPLPTPAKPLGHHHCTVIRSPPPFALADLLLLEKNCHYVRWFRKVKKFLNHSICFVYRRLHACSDWRYS